ncbi:hypothetical protein [Lactococcus lactis]|uniref:hypothetical protein n=1 Tax=Lactococcus lactis TaxID=1358 RepID=UPI001179EA3C|nr:hypothetical protein [Lactococcus lactis]
METKGAAMSELEKAKQIAAEAFNFKSKAYTTNEQQNEIIEVNRKAFMQILSLSSLTIPKSIAVELDGYFKYINPFEAILKDNSVRINDVVKENRDYLAFLHSNLELCISYLAGKSLGVDLVKVVEG